MLTTATPQVFQDLADFAAWMDSVAAEWAADATEATEFSEHVAAELVTYGPRVFVLD